MNPNPKVAVAIAAILAAGAVHAQTAIDPTSAENGTPLYIAGSSAAKNAILQVLEIGTSSGTPVFCAGTGYSVFSSTPDPNFFAVSCKPAASTGIAGANGTTVFTAWYRAEGGSVTGALPIISGSTINQLTLNTNFTQTSSGYTVTVGGNATGNGVDDSFTNVFKAPVQLGITDVEPGALVKSNYPSAYSVAAFGSATATQLGNLGSNNGQVIFDQVFGIFVNTTGTGFTSAEQAGNGQAVVTGTASGLAISAQSIAAILQGKVTDWSKVPLANSATGAAVTGTTSSTITLINREKGSGSRTATDIFFTNDHCTTQSANLPIAEPGPTDYFSTLDVLTAANAKAGSITYATIDQAGASFPNLTLVAIDGVQPSNIAAAAGQYGDWFEAYAITNPSVSSTSAQGTLIANLISAFQDVSELGFGQADLLANPLTSSVSPALPVTSTNGNATSKTIYTNPYSRNGNSCTDPASEL
jgi:periplasmic binding family protein